jgi:hypothetical protein
MIAGIARTGKTAISLNGTRLRWPSMAVISGARSARREVSTERRFGQRNDKLVRIGIAS